MWEGDFVNSSNELLQHLHGKMEVVNLSH